MGLARGFAPRLIPSSSLLCSGSSSWNPADALVAEDQLLEEGRAGDLALALVTSLGRRARPGRWRAPFSGEFSRYGNQLAGSARVVVVGERVRAAEIDGEREHFRADWLDGVGAISAPR